MGALSTSEGVPTGGIYGFAAIAMEIVKQLNPTKVVVAWDSRSSTAKRKAIFSEYKAGRVKPGEDFYAQIPYLKELILALGWSFVECEDYEADDIIGTLALQADELTERFAALKSASAQSQGDEPSSFRSSTSPCDSSLSSSSEDCNLDQWETFIVSSDLDMLQIVDENTRMYRILKGFSELEELDVPAVEAKYGIKKAQFLDLKALKGDASDNIPGVPGVGEKTAVKLLQQYGTVEGVYEHLDEITGSVRKKLEAGHDSALMSYQLAKIMTDAPVRLADLPDLEINQNRILEALNKLEFRSLARKFLARNKPEVKEVDKASQQPLGATKKQKLNGEAAEKNRGLDELLGPSEAKIEAMHSEKVAKVPKKAAGAVDFSQQTLEIAQELPDGTLISWNVKDLMHKNLTVAEEVLSGKEFWDLGQAAFLLNPLERYVEHTDEREAYEQQKQAFAQRSELYKIFIQFDLPLIPVLYKMESYGMLIDREYFARLKTEFEVEVANLERKVWDYAGKEFNVNSPVQLSEVLFGQLGLPTKGIKKTARGYSTGVKELDKLEDEHPIIGAVKEYREAAKLLSTYIAPLPELADRNGRIHTTFNQNVTATGRLSSTNPNLQNIPVRTEVGKRIREGFVAAPGKVLVSADYSQFELRLAAALAGDEDLIEDFNSGVDIHTKTAAEAFGVPMDKVTKAQRRAAKVINFGILYGMSVRGLAEAADMQFYEAKRFIEDYFELRKPIKQYLDKILEQARTEGHVETYFGRRRPTPDVKSSNFIVRTGAERAAQNMPIQGTEADLMKRAMIRVDTRLPEGAKMVMQVHDSLIIECDESMKDEVAKILREEMEQVMPELPVKLAVEVSVGQNWGEL